MLQIENLNFWNLNQRKNKSIKFIFQLNRCFNYQKLNCIISLWNLSIKTTNNLNIYLIRIRQLKIISKIVQQKETSQKYLNEKEELKQLLESEEFKELFDNQQQTVQITTDDQPEKEEKQKEQKYFDLQVKSFEQKSKLKVIKEIKSILGIGLKDSKDLVESVPFIVKKQIKKDELDKLKDKLEKIGCVLEIK